jgi:hypothetical protein
MFGKKLEDYKHMELVKELRRRFEKGILDGMKRTSSSSTYFDTSKCDIALLRAMSALLDYSSTAVSIALPAFLFDSYGRQDKESVEYWKKALESTKQILMDTTENINNIDLESIKSEADRARENTK